MKTLKRYRLLALILLFDFYVLATNFPKGQEIFYYTGMTFREMLAVLPPIFILLGLLDVWVPRETIIRLLGPDSGIRGIGLSIFLGAAAAGPLYAAFPVAAVMAKKGAKYGNIIIFLGAWSTLKIPLLLFEMSALGLPFTLTRSLINIPGIILIALLVERLVSKDEQNIPAQRQAPA